MSAAPQARVTPIGAAEIDAAREYFTGLHTRISDAWQALDPGAQQRRDQWQRPAGEVLSGNGRLSLIELGKTFDRAGAAYNEFVPLDGKFRDNVVLQVKNGPLDFQPREPFSPRL